jgi:hypothetical protein
MLFAPNISPDREILRHRKLAGPGNTGERIYQQAGLCFLKHLAYIKNATGLPQRQIKSDEYHFLFWIM